MRDDRELVAAQPGRRVLGSHAPEQALRGRAQQLVARRVAERVVHVLEAVEVDQDHRHRVAPRQGPAQPVEQQHAVGQAGQRVVVGLVRELVLQRPPFGDVAPVPDEPAHVGVGQQVLADRLHRADAAVARAQPQLDRVHEAGLLGEERDGLPDARALVRLDVHEQGEVQQVLRPVAQQGLGGGADVVDDPGRVGHHREVRRALHERAEPAFAGPQGVLGGAALADLALQRVVGRRDAAPAAARHHGDPDHAERQHQPDQRREPELAAPAALQRGGGGEVELLLLLHPHRVDAPFRAHDEVEGRQPSGVVVAARHGQFLPREGGQHLSGRRAAHGRGRRRAGRRRSRRSAGAATGPLARRRRVRRSSRPAR